MVLSKLTVVAPNLLLKSKILLSQPEFFVLVLALLVVSVLYDCLVYFTATQT
jgi:hypothetical protein